jgi:TATA-binding protein-associated factor Taf7
MMTNDVRCTCEIKSRIAMAKQHSRRRRRRRRKEKEDEEEDEKDDEEEDEEEDEKTKKRKKKKTIFTSKLDYTLRKKPVKCYIWSVAS